MLSLEFLEKDRMNVSLIGGGVMGEVFLSAGIRSGLFDVERTIVCDIRPERCEELAKKYKVRTTSNLQEAFASSELAFLAVKPQDLEAIKSDLSDRTCLVSIMAGVTIKTLQDLFKTENVIRVMPNTPAAIGEGMSVWTVAGSVSEDQRNLVSSLLSAIGAEYFVEDEEVLDMATAVSGSGPAFVFFFLESLISAAEKIGFPLEEAVNISVQTLYGAAAYARESDYDPATLRAMVTSKGGTTAEGIGVLEDFKFREILENCVRAAYNRSKELSKLR